MGTPFAYYRKRYENGGLYEETWQLKHKRWHRIPLRIIWMQISGECTLTQVSYKQFKHLVPEAFADGRTN